LGVVAETAGGYSSERNWIREGRTARTDAVGVLLIVGIPESLDLR
jgi:hypothetical protein